MSPAKFTAKADAGTGTFSLDEGGATRAEIFASSQLRTQRILRLRRGHARRKMRQSSPERMREKSAWTAVAVAAKSPSFPSTSSRRFSASADAGTAHFLWMRAGSLALKSLLHRSSEPNGFDVSGAVLRGRKCAGLPLDGCAKNSADRRAICCEISPVPLVLSTRILSESRCREPGVFAG